MKLRFLSTVFCGLAVAFVGELSAAKWLDKSVQDIPWQDIVIVNNGLSGSQVGLHGFLRVKKCSREMLCDIGLFCIQAIMADPSRLSQTVPGSSVTYQVLLSAVHRSLTAKTEKKGQEVASISALVQDFLHSMAVKSNHAVIRGHIAGTGSRRQMVTLLQEYLIAKKQTILDACRPVYHDPYQPFTAQAKPEDAVGGLVQGALLGQPVVPLLSGNGSVSLPQQLLTDVQRYPGACPGCQQPKGQQEGKATLAVAPTQSPRDAKKVGPYAAATVLGVALTGLMIDCAVRKKRSWLVRAAQATGRGFRSLWRWLTASGRPA